MCLKVRDNLEKVLRMAAGAAPWVHLIQRRYPTQRSVPIVDASVQFDLRTAYASSAMYRWKEMVKPQPEWIEAAYRALLQRHSNLQFAVGAIFPYSRCKVVGTPRVVDCIAMVWLACRPLITTIVGGVTPSAQNARKE